jgi:hypothetical protein
MRMDDRQAYFLIIVGGVCNDARLAGFDVELVTDDDRRVRGVPATAQRIDGEPELDDTGMPRELHVGDVAVQLETVTEIRLHRPRAERPQR